MNQVQQAIQAAHKRIEHNLMWIKRKDSVNVRFGFIAQDQDLIQRLEMPRMLKACLRTLGAKVEEDGSIKYNQPVCPWCATVDKSWWEVIEGCSGQMNTECGRCSLPYIMRWSAPIIDLYLITFNTSKES